MVIPKVENSYLLLFVKLMIWARKFLNSTIVVKCEIWAVQIKDSTIVKFMILGPALERFYNCRICGLSFKRVFPKSSKTFLRNPRWFVCLCHSFVFFFQISSLTKISKRKSQEKGL